MSEDGGKHRGPAAGISRRQQGRMTLHAQAGTAEVMARMAERLRSGEPLPPELNPMLAYWLEQLAESWAPGSGRPATAWEDVKRGLLRLFEEYRANRSPAPELEDFREHVVEPALIEDGHSEQEARDLAREWAEWVRKGAKGLRREARELAEARRALRQGSQ